MKNKKLVFIIIGVVLIAGLVAFFLLKDKLFDNSKKVVDTTTNKYVAYVKINPSVKLEYERVCKVYKDGTKECEKPAVYNYELVNDDAKEVYKDVDLLKDSKNLSDVIDLLCKTAKDKGIDTTEVSIKSDWSELNTYLAEETKKTETTETTNTETTDNNTTTTENNQETTTTTDTTPTYKVETEAKEEVINNISTDVEEEQKAQEEAEKKAKEEAERKAKTIFLKDNVKYTVGGRGYCCDNCFTDSLIRTAKNSKGYKVTNADHSRIDFMYIASLTSPYNETKYKGGGLISKLTAAGAEECGGLGGGEPELLTKSICSSYNLLCE